jgi:hypothetical protein
LDLREYLESRLHAKVDLVMESALKPGTGKRILPWLNMSKGADHDLSWRNMDKL